MSLYLSKQCGSGKGIWMQEQVLQEPTVDSLFVLPTEQLINQFCRDFELHDRVIKLTSTSIKYGENLLVQLMPL